MTDNETPQKLKPKCKQSIYIQSIDDYICSRTVKNVSCKGLREDRNNCSFWKEENGGVCVV